MKISKKLYVPTVLAMIFVCPASMFSAMAPITTVLNALLAQEHSAETSALIKASVRRFITNQQHVAANLKALLEQHMGATIVEDFAIPEENKRDIREKLRPFTAQPIFYRSEDTDADRIPQLEAFKAFEGIGLKMNKAAEKAFWNTDSLDASAGAACAEGRIATEKDFNRAQMEVAVEHECCHVKNGDGDLKVLFTCLSAHKEHFSEEEFRKIMGAFGEDFLSSRKALIDAITRDAQTMRIPDFKVVGNFDMDLTAFVRYFETRVDKTILASGDKKKMEAYRDFYKNRNDSQAVKERAACDKDNVSWLLEQGRAIPLAIADFTWPTDQERVDTCDAALAELEAASAAGLCAQLSKTDIAQG